MKYYHISVLSSIFISTNGSKNSGGLYVDVTVSDTKSFKTRTSCLVDNVTFSIMNYNYKYY